MSEPSMSQKIEITYSPIAGKTSVVVDGIDITYWITAEPIVLESTPDGNATLAIKITAPNVTVKMLP